MSFCKKPLTFFLIMIVIFHPNFTHAENNNTTWGNFEDTYIYSNVKEICLYDDSGKIAEIQQYDKEYNLFNFSVKNNILLFRTSDYLIVEPFLNYKTEEGLYRLLLSKFDFNQINMSIKLGYVFDEENSLYYLVDAHLTPFANFYEFSYPFDMMNLFFINHVWDFFYGLFLPTKSPFFAFRTDYSNHENFNCTTFKIEINRHFRYSGRKYYGYDIKIEFIGGIYFGYTVVFENHKIEYKYSENGILYYFKDEAEVYSNITNIVHLESKYNQIVKLRVIGEKIYKSDSISVLISISIFFIVDIILNKRKRKKHS